MQKRNWLLIVLSILFILCSILVAYLSISWSHDGETKKVTPKDYHFVVLYSGDNDSFISELNRGLQDKAEEENVWVTFEHFDSMTITSHLNAFALAIDAQVDGIITNVPDYSGIGRLIDRAALEGIPVATIADDIYGSQRRVHIGIDYEELGQKAAELITQLMPNGARTAIISYPLTQQNNECLQKTRGFINYMKHQPSYVIGIEHLQELNSADAYELTKQLLDSGFKYDSYFCMDEQITLAVAECLKMRGIDDICVIGCGESNAAYSYLKSGIIDVLLTENAYHVGSIAVDELYRYIREGGLPYIVETDVRVITDEDIVQNE